MYISREKLTPLYLAVRQEKVNIIQLLVEQGNYGNHDTAADNYDSAADNYDTIADSYDIWLALD